MKRWHEEYSRTFREWKKHWLSHLESNLERIGSGQEHPFDPFEIDCSCDQQKGRFRKMRAFDCGNPHCYMCHSDKYPKRDDTRQEKVSQLRLKEGISDLDHGKD